MDKKYFGVMLDCSRNAVLRVETVKRYIDCLKKMGYNMVMLYTEDTYEVDNNPSFGYLRGKYTKEELKDIVAYGESVGIELIPCIQTLAHLNQIFRWSEYREILDCDDILLVDHEKTYELIENMIKSSRECFKTDRIHIGMDEAMRVGLGNFLKNNGYQNRFDILSRHLNKVAEICEKYGFRPMMWSDMFFRFVSGDGYYVRDPEMITEEVTDLVPKNVDLVYWDYYSGAKYIYDNMIDAHQRFKGETWFAGGAWTWTGFTPHNNYAMGKIKMALSSCREKKVDNVIMTMWGDDGAETSFFSVLPSLFYAIELYNGNEDMDLIKEKFFNLFGISFDDMMKLDLPSVSHDGDEKTTRSFDKLMLYCDPFFGVFDPYVVGDEAERFKQYVEILSEHSDNEEFGYLFKSAAALCDVHTVKYTLGKRTRAAYESGDRKQVAALLDDYSLAIEKIEVFYRLFREAWMKEKRPNGFEIQDFRIGGVIQRLKHLRGILADYAEGKIDRIEELDEKLIEQPGDETKHNWAHNFVSIIGHNM